MLRSIFKKNKYKHEFLISFSIQKGKDTGFAHAVVNTNVKFENEQEIDEMCDSFKKKGDLDRAVVLSIFRMR